MGKYVFKKYGSFIHPCGEFARETDKMVFWRGPRSGVERRGFKDDYIVVETANPSDVEQAYKAAYRDHTPAVEDAMAALRLAEAVRQERALDAALAKAEGTR